MGRPSFDSVFVAFGSRRASKRMTWDELDLAATNHHRSFLWILIPHVSTPLIPASHVEASQPSKQQHYDDLFSRRTCSPHLFMCLNTLVRTGPAPTSPSQPQRTTRDAFKIPDQRASSDMQHRPSGRSDTAARAAAQHAACGGTRD